MDKIVLIVLIIVIVILIIALFGGFGTYYLVSGDKKEGGEADKKK